MGGMPKGWDFSMIFALEVKAGVFAWQYSQINPATAAPANRPRATAMMELSWL
jgi:hypothetical protein